MLLVLLEIRYLVTLKVVVGVALAPVEMPTLVMPDAPTAEMWLMTEETLTTPICPVSV